MKSLQIQMNKSKLFPNSTTEEDLWNPCVLDDCEHTTFFFSFFFQTCPVRFQMSCEFRIEPITDVMTRD